MCLAVPAKVKEIHDAVGKVDISGVTRDISLMLLPETQVGDYVLVHAGAAVQIVDEEEAQATMEAFRELEEREQAYFAGKIADR